MKLPQKQAALFELMTTPTQQPEYEYRQLANGQIGVFSGDTLVSTQGPETPIDAPEDKYSYQKLANGKIGVFSGRDMVSSWGPEELADDAEGFGGDYRKAVVARAQGLQDEAGKLMPTVRQIVNILDGDIRTGPGAAIMQRLGTIAGTKGGDQLTLLDQYLTELGIQNLANFKGAISEKELATALSNAGTVSMRKKKLLEWVTRNIQARKDAYERHNAQVFSVYGGDPTAMDVFGIDSGLWGWWDERSKPDVLPDELPGLLPPPSLLDLTHTRNPYAHPGRGY